MAQLWGTQTKITLSSVTADDRDTLPQWSLTSVCFLQWLDKEELCKAFFPLSLQNSISLTEYFSS